MKNIGGGQNGRSAVRYEKTIIEALLVILLVY